MRYLLGLTLALFWFLEASATESSLNDTYLGSREGDPASLVENVSAIHGNYSDFEVDLIVPGPDSLVLSRYYGSRDNLLTNSSFGGWRFNSHCFLSVLKDSLPRTYTTAEGKFDYTHISIGTNEGSILTYAGWQNTTNSNARSLFKVDVEGDLLGLANTARGSVNAWTNLKNNELYFNAQSNHFELLLSSGGRRVYVPSLSTLGRYLLQRETLPSGNKIFYEYEGEALSLIKMTNASEEKVLSWIKIQYGPIIHIDTSDGKTVDYHFQQDLPLLSEVIRSDKPSIKYQYRIVETQALLIKKDLPEGRFVKIDYYADGENKNKVESVTSPAGIGGTTSMRFSYTPEMDGSGFTQVDGPLARKAVYRFDDQSQLTAVEQYLNGALYRVHKKIWGKKRDATNLIATSVEDGSGSVYYYKSFAYDDKGNISEEREYGNLTGANPEALVLDEEGIPKSNQESHAKTYSYRTVKDIDVVSQKDSKGSSVKLGYKKGTNLLIRKFILDKKEIKKRWFYNYNEDGVLTRIIVDDGDEEAFESAYYIGERHTTTITPKQELPNVGVPEIIEEKYLDIKTKKEISLKKTVNGFDSQGNIASIGVYDASGEHRYTVTRIYEHGLLKLETDPIGNSTRYTYDGNQNLASTVHSNSSLSFEYRYDLKNRLIYIGEKDGKGNCFETRHIYDAAGNKTSEIDRFGNETVYVPDSLSRIASATYPEIKVGEHSSSKPLYTYGYDLFDHVISIIDPKEEATKKAYTIHGKPTLIHYPDGSQELFKYDPEGSLHRHRAKDGTVRVFEYDYQGRIAHVEHYTRSNKASGDWLSSIYYDYDAFHMTSQKDEEGDKTTYTYDGAGRLATLTKDDQKAEFIYDSLGRTHGVKKWKSAKTFTLEIKEHDLLNRVTEERTEDTQGKILLKSRRSYDDAGRVKEVIGYPQNQESVLARYDYDDFGRLREVMDAFESVTKIDYEDSYIDEWGQKVLKRTQTDPLGTQTEEIFDPANRLAKTTKKDKTGQLLAESVFFFDTVGNLNLEKDAVISKGELLRTYRAHESYTGGKLKSATIAAGTAEERTFGWEYDAYGNPFTITKPGIKEPITYQYDQTGRMRSVSYKGEKYSQESIHKFSYDKKGNVKEIELGKSRTITYKLNPNNLLKSETVKDEFGSYQVKLVLDGEGCIEVIQLPDGSLVEYTYEGPFVKSLSRQSKEKKELYNYRIVSRDQMGHILEEVLVGHAGARKQTWDKAGRRTGILTDFFLDQVPEDGYDFLSHIKKRNVTLDGGKHNAEYDYNALYEIISEKGKREHTYSYDSLGNRLKRDNSSYKINDLNQVLEAEGKIFTFDPMGNLETKTTNGQTWNFQTNPLGHLVSVQDPNQTTISFTYDLNGKRLSKKVEAKGKKTKIYRYFYLGQMELGCLDEKGNIIELKIPSDPNNPETSPCIAIEIKKETYAPLYDLQGNVACLIDPERRKVVESYHYSAFGEEEITNERGKVVADSAVSNPWRYRGKRVDQEIGLVYFGQRYYDPAVGRWISPDPIGSIDGPNLYRFCRNNPLKFVDYFGLAAEMNGDEFDDYFYGEYEPHCYCERHRECKRGGDIGSSFGGVMDLLSNPRFQGSMQAFGGLVEAGIGGGMTLASGAIAAPLGWPVMAHGLDQFITGMSVALSGNPRETVTAQLLQEIGLSPYAAGLIDSSLSIAGSMGGVFAIHASRLAAFPNFRLPISSALTESSGWVLPEGGGGALIKGRWYTEHALERMAPNTPRVMAELQSRFLDRAKVASQKLYPKELHKWRLENAPNPRGIPPLVVEAEIAQPGSTGVRVILNENGHVITVIPGG
jgi:RHS repeat-associated protein